MLRQVRAARITVTAVVGDAEFGDNATLRRTLHRARLPYAVGVSSDLKVFLGTPRLHAAPPPGGRGRPRTRPSLAADTATVEARAWGAAQPPGAWRLVSWRNGTNAPWRARFCAVRVTPAHDWRERRLAPEVWLLGEPSGTRGPDRRRMEAMPEPITRDGIIDALRDMPEKATIDDAIERLVFLARIEAGLKERARCRRQCPPRGRERRRFGL